MSGTYLVYDNIVLPVSELLDYSRENVYDGPTYIGTRVHISIRSVYNPSAVSYAADSAFPRFLVPIVQKGGSPAVTEATIAFDLEQPRKLLIFVVGGQVLFQSPMFRPDTKLYHCDAKYGPLPIRRRVSEIIGRKTFLVDFSIEAFVNESGNRTDGQMPPVILSHRWTRRQDIDENFFSTVTTNGHAIFRTDVLAYFRKLKVGAAAGTRTGAPNFQDRFPATSVLPDDFRSFLFHPVPTKFRRVAVSVTPSEDHTQLEYMLIDRQQAFAWPKGVARMHATQTVSSTTGMLQHLGMKIGGAVGAMLKGDVGEVGWAKTIATIAGGAAGFMAGGPVGGGAGAMAGNALVGFAADGGGKAGLVNQLENMQNILFNGLYAAQNAMSGNLIPTITMSVNVQVWGDPGSTRFQLQNVALNAISSRFGIAFEQHGFFKGQSIGSTQHAITHELTDKFVSVSASKVMPSPAKILNVGANPGSWLPAISLAFPETAEYTPGAILAHPGGKNAGVGVPSENRAYFLDYNAMASQIFLTDFWGTESPATANSKSTPHAKKMPGDAENL